MNPKVSIIAPTYNHEKLISYCIESVLNQTFQEWELILIDDCSNDRTADIIQSYLPHDLRIKFIKHETRWGAHRLVETYDQALSLSKGEYIAIIEGDDYWPKKKLEIQTAIMEGNENIVLSYGMVALDYNGTVKKSHPHWKKSVLNNSPRGAILLSFLFGANPILSQTVMLRRNALLKVGGFHPKDRSLFLIDYPTWMELSFAGEFRFIPKLLGVWRMHPSQITSTNTQELFLNQIDYIKSFQNIHDREIREIKEISDVISRKMGFFIYICLCRNAFKNNDIISGMRYLKKLLSCEIPFQILPYQIFNICKLPCWIFISLKDGFWGKVMKLTLKLRLCI
jgi:glycosyltransferase involved in cell wall biosynthesis